MSSKEVGIEEGRKKLGDLVTAAQYGKTTIVTRNGRPAAMITPVPLHITLRDITVGAIDQGDWRNEAIENWIEAAAGEGHGFTVLAVYDEGNVLAVVAQDDWTDEREMKPGERITLRIDRPGEVEEGEGEMVGIEPGPYIPAEHPVPYGPWNPAPDHPVETTARGRFPVRLNGSGGISLGWDGGEIDMSDDDAEQLSAALAQMVIARRQPSL